MGAGGAVVGGAVVGGASVGGGAGAAVVDGLGAAVVGELVVGGLVVGDERRPDDPLDERDDELDEELDDDRFELGTPSSVMRPPERVRSHSGNDRTSRLVWYAYLNSFQMRAG